MIHGYFSNYHYIRECLDCSKSLIQAPPHWSQQFQSIGVGLGALLAGLGGLKIGLDWLEQTRLKRKVSRLTQRYPIDSLNIDYELVDTESIPGKWWLLDKRSDTKHWIRNLETTRDFGWSYSMVRHIPDKELEKYKEEKPLNTREL